MIIKYSSDDGTVETRQVHCFQKAGTIEVVAASGKSLGTFRVDAVSVGDTTAGAVGGTNDAVSCNQLADNTPGERVRPLSTTADS